MNKSISILLLTNNDYLYNNSYIHIHIGGKNEFCYQL